MTEAQFQQRVMETARLLGWRCVHFRPARTERGYRTAYSGDDGFPDLVLARAGTVLIVELKSDRGSLSAAQREWLKALGMHACVWRPRDWERVKTELGVHAEVGR